MSNVRKLFYYPRNKSELETPCLLIDIDILTDNIVKMQNFINVHGKSLRPHSKSHKCSAIAQMQIDNGAEGICAAKLSEAEALADAGIKSILITGPIVVESKIRRIIDLARNIDSLIIAVDNPDIVKKINHIASHRRTFIDVLIDVDIGLGRTGISARDIPEFSNILKNLDYINLRGLQAYAGQVQHIESFEKRAVESSGCLQKVIPYFSHLNRQMGGAAILSVGGTGTYAIDVQISDVTELQPGSYPLMDADYLSIEPPPADISRDYFRPALTLLTTVLSANRSGSVIVDAGTKSMYKDGGTPFPINSGQRHLKYTWHGDEYGQISSREGREVPGVGEVLQLVVSHCDPTVNLFDSFYIIKNNNIIDEWDIDLRGLSQ